jgi:hypothetical protein
MTFVTCLDLLSAHESPVDMNDLAVKALRALDSELRNQNVATRIQLASQLPLTMGTAVNCRR